MLSDNVRECSDRLRRQLDEAAIEALTAGKNWAEGPVEDVSPARWPKPFDILQPMEINLHVKCGPVDDDWVPPAGWRLVRRKDWLEAGMPGLDTMREIEQPRCGCKSETVQRVILGNGACGMGGCPYGGDL